MAGRFSHFADVRVHADGRAAEATRAVNAPAFTAGRHIVRAPEAAAVLAHEVAHLVQQSGSVAGDGSGLVADAPLERDAERAATAAIHGTPGRVRERVAGGPIQRFTSREHRSLGDTATGSAMVNVGGDTPTARFELTPRRRDRVERKLLRGRRSERLAAIPGDGGRRVGTRDEIIWVLRLLDASDPRFAPGGLWERFAFSEAVKAVVNERYQRLAAENTSHFLAPSGRDASGRPIRSRASQPSAARSYRMLHERATLIAYRAAASGGGVSHPMAMEAAAQHFLTDAFAAGHLRMPVGLIRAYWGGRYPLFW